MSKFVHLHLHTHYSTLDGACRIKDIIELAKTSDMDAIAITDHGNMFGAVDFYTTLKAAGLKPIIGYETYVAENSRFEKNSENKGKSYHLTLLAKNDIGYRNLIKLTSTAFLEGFYYKPRIDKELLAEHCEGVIALSGCLGGEAAQAILKDDIDRARTVLTEYKEMFEDGDFYVELQENGLPEQVKANASLVPLARELGLKTVATNDVHYTNYDDRGAHDVLLCIGTGKKRSDENRMRFNSDANYFRSSSEMIELFKDLPEAIESTVEIADKCNLELELGKFRYPKFDVPKGKTEAEYLRELTFKGAEERYGDNITDEINERLEKELGIITRMGFPGYMLIVGDIVARAHELGIPTGPGRGSAAGSLLSYCLGITNLDPLKYDLLFERFMNEGRNEMPDIDLDFCQSRREEMIDYVTEKYGREFVAQIITFGTMAARAAIRDVGRVLDVPLFEIDQVAKLIPMGAKNIPMAIEMEPELAERQKNNPQIAEVLEIATRLEGLTRQPGKHAAGVVIADEPIQNCCPLYKQAKTGDITTQFDMGAITEIGLLKVDFLGLQTLTMMHMTTDIIKETRGEEIVLDDLPLDDKETYKLFGEGRTKGVFQFESGGMRDLLTKALPDRFEDLILLNAMYRPGPMEHIPTLIARKFGEEPMPQVAPEVDALLEETYGIMAYQEQVMRIAQVAGNFTLSDADVLRKAMGKKKVAIVDKMEEQFLAGAKDNGFETAVAKQLYTDMGAFAGYGFNKSHAAAYSFVAFQTAYLKAHYPTEFMAALLTLDMGNTDKLAEYIDEAKVLGIEVLGPDVNSSNVGFTVTKDKVLRFGMAAIKGVGEGAVRSIITAREEGGNFVSLIDFCERVELKTVNKTSLECLIKGGAFDSLGVTRSRLYESIGRALETGSKAQADRAAGQESLFASLMDDDATSNPAAKVEEGLMDVPPWSEKKQLSEEKSVLGVYISGHPLSRYENWLRIYANVSTSDIKSGEYSDKPVVLGGLLSTVEFRTAKASGNPWASIIIEDLQGMSDGRIFSKTLERVKDKLVQDAVVLALGRIEKDGTAIMIDHIIPYEEAAANLLGKVLIELNENELDDALLDSVMNSLRNNKGRSEVFFRIVREDENSVIVRTGADIKVAPGNQLEAELASILGEVKIIVRPLAERFENEFAYKPRKNFNKKSGFSRG